MGIGGILVIVSAMLFGLMPILARQIDAMGGNPLSLCVYRFIFCLPFLLFQSYPYISSGTATTIHFVYPILVLLGNVLLFHAKMTGKKRFI